MTNEYGVRLDRNGYAPSIVPGHGEWQCYGCGRNRNLERHEIYGGAFRRKSKEYGLWVHLCDMCHRESPESAHRSGGYALKADGQEVAMNTYGWTVDEFRQRFGKNYLEGWE